MNKTKVSLAGLCFPMFVAAIATVIAATGQADSPKWMNIKTSSCLLEARLSSKVPGHLLLEVRSVKSRCVFASNFKALEVDRIMNFPLAGSMSFQDKSGQRVSIRSEGENGWWRPAVLFSNIGLENPKLQTLVVEKGKVLVSDFTYTEVLREAQKLITSKESPNIAKIKIRIPVEIETADNNVDRVDLETDWIDLPDPR